MPTFTDIDTSAALPYADAMELQRVELDRTIALLRTLDPADWTARTDCPDWDVRRMELHVLGACEAGASLRENLHQLRAATRHRTQHGGPLEAALSAVQVRERDELQPAQLLERLESVAPRTVRGRSRLPRLFRRMGMKVDGPVVERWTLGYLSSTIYLRDLWMHRVDACLATGRDLELTTEHDGRIVADVVAEWCRRHGRAVELVLLGAAGGAYRAVGSAGDKGVGGGPVRIELDAVEFCRTLAGRLPAPDGPLRTIVPF
jgi:uncharacterized protein (TIGR03083 family)